MIGHLQPSPQLARCVRHVLRELHDRTKRSGGFRRSAGLGSGGQLYPVPHNRRDETDRPSVTPVPIGFAVGRGPERPNRPERRNRVGQERTAPREENTQASPTCPHMAASGTPWPCSRSRWSRASSCWLAGSPRRRRCLRNASAFITSSRGNCSSCDSSSKNPIRRTYDSPGWRQSSVLHVPAFG